MGVPLLDMSRQYAYLKAELDTAVINVLTHGGFVLGPEVKMLEQEITELTRTPHAIGVASGTDALLVALIAAGVEAGDEVITTNFSFFATAGVIHRLGAKPVLVDIEPDTYNIDPQLIESAVTPRTKAIIPVHLFGQCADMDPIMEIARARQLVVIEDAAQAIGSEYRGRKAGSIGDMGAFSFYPTKNLGGAGDGGMITTTSDDYADACRMIRVHGAKRKYYHDMVGLNSRLDTLQAAVLLVKSKYLHDWSLKRQQWAKRYNDAFKASEAIRTPVIRDYATFHIFNQYTIAVNNRDEVVDGLRTAEIGCMIYYPVPFHKQPCFSYLGHAPDEFPVSSRAAESVLSLPVYPEMTQDEQDEVIEAVIKLAK
jgi:dTDP-4-amino-4,6-dideoxygalactose transaminase